MPKDIIHEDERYRIFTHIKGVKGCKSRSSQQATKSLCVVDKSTGTTIQANELPEHLREKIYSVLNAGDL